MDFVCSVYVMLHMIHVMVIGLLVCQLLYTIYETQYSIFMFHVHILCRFRLCLPPLLPSLLPFENNMCIYDAMLRLLLMDHGSWVLCSRVGKHSRIWVCMFSESKSMETKRKNQTTTNQNLIEKNFHPNEVNKYE